MTLNERFTLLVELKVPELRRFRCLAEASGIGFESWRKAYNGGQRPTSEMLEFVGLAWPEHAFWLLTGCTDNEFSHTSPTASSTNDVPHEARTAGTELLRLRASLLNETTLTRNKKKVLTLARRKRLAEFLVYAKASGDFAE